MRKVFHVLIAEDDDLLRSGLELVIQAEEDMQVGASATNGLEALTFIQQRKPDIVLMDLKMPQMDGIACIKEIRKLHSDLPILILTTFNEEEFIFKGLAYGANGYLLKNLDFNTLVQTIRKALNGQYVLPAEVASKIAKYVVNNNTYTKEREIDRFFARDKRFTKKEQEIIMLLLERPSNKELAAKLYLTEGTVKNHLTIIYDKLGAQNRLDAIHRLEDLIFQKNLE